MKEKYNPFLHEMLIFQGSVVSSFLSIPFLNYNLGIEKFDLNNPICLFEFGVIAATQSVACTAVQQWRPPSLVARDLLRAPGLALSYLKGKPIE